MRITEFSKNTRVSHQTSSNNDSFLVSPSSTPLPVPFQLHLFKFTLFLLSQLKLPVLRGDLLKPLVYHQSPSLTSTVLNTQLYAILRYAHGNIKKNSGEMTSSSINDVDIRTSM
jgi:hypothetical protein